MPKRLPTDPMRPVAFPSYEEERRHTPVDSSIAEVIAFRVERLEADLPKLATKVDEQGTRMEKKFDEQNEILLDLTKSVSGTTAAVEQLSRTTSQAMGLVAESARGQIQVQTIERTVTIQDNADLRKTRRAFWLKLTAIAGTIATAITAAIASGRC